VLRDFVSARARAIPPSGIRRFFDIAADDGGCHIPGCRRTGFRDPLVCVCEASIYSIEQGSTAYTCKQGDAPASGAPSAATSIPGSVFATILMRRLIVTCGVSEAADIAIRAVRGSG